MVDILLATYNGEKFIHKQLDSILAQDYHDWILYVRDDNSTDSTPEILNQYTQKYPPKIQIVKDTLGNLGFCQNFKQLMYYSANPYIMFCDQDDIWKHDKVSGELKYIKKIEEKYTDVPILVFSDLEGIDANDNLIFESFIQKNRYEINPILFSRLLFRNVVTGCTIMMNRLLLSHMLQMPDSIKCHDHWAALVCLLHGGKIEYLDKPTVSYRQHSDNQIGDLSMRPKDKVMKLFRISQYHTGRERTVKHYQYLERQIQMLQNSGIGRCDTAEKQLINRLSDIWNLTWYRRVAFLYHNHCLPRDLYLKAVMILYYLYWGN